MTETSFTITNKGLSTAAVRWVTISAKNETDKPAEFTIEKIALYDPYTYDRNPKGK